MAIRCSTWLRETRSVVHLEQIRAMQSVLSQKFRHRSDRRNKNDQRRQIRIRLRPQRLRNRQQLLQRVSPERQARRAHHRILQQCAPALRDIPGNRNEIRIFRSFFRCPSTDTSGDTPSPPLDAVRTFHTRAPVSPAARGRPHPATR